MNEHPGVKPVVVSPEQPASVRPVRSLPRGAQSMPFGLSANSVGLGDGGLNWRRMLFVGIPLTVVLALALGTWLYAQRANTLSLKNVANGAYSYDFLFYKTAEPVNLLAGQGYKYDSKALAIAKPTSEEVVRECAQLGEKWTEVFAVTVEGVPHPACVLNGNVFAVMFAHGQANHLFEITYTSPQAVNRNDVRRSMESLKVTLN